MDAISHIDLSQKVYEILGARIINGDLKPGEKLTQQKIAKYLEISRMPLHRAFQMLENDLLVEQKPRRGFYVRQFDNQEILDAFEVREVLEGLAVRKLAEHANHQAMANRLSEVFRPFADAKPIDEDAYRKQDRRFHLQIMEMTENLVLQKMNKVGNFLLHAFRAGLIRPPEETLPEHLRIIHCIASGDAPGAEKAMIDHIRQSTRLFKKTLQDRGSASINV